MHLCTLEEDNGRRDASKTFAYLPNVSHAFREATQRRRGVCCEQLVCVSSYKRISVPILFLFGNMSGLDEDLCVFVFTRGEDIWLLICVPVVGRGRMGGGWVVAGGG